ncbi:MAG: hypothetical protein R2713_19130 [Ilumatobacteraceae bacterium]
MSSTRRTVDPDVIRSAAAELSVAADHVDRYRERVHGLVLPLQGGNHDDAVAAMYEAERSTAHRLPRSNAP